MNQQKAMGKGIKSLKPWAAIALALALALAGYGAVLGYNFFRYRAEEQSLGVEVGRLSEIMRRPMRDVDQTDLRGAEEKRRKAYAPYDSGHQDKLVSLVVNAASDASVSLARVTVAETGARSIGDVSYTLQPLNLWISGSSSQIFSFLDLLHQRTPMVHITKVELRGLPDRPAAEIRVIFYLSPQYLTRKDAKQ